MSVHMKKRLINKDDQVLQMQYQGNVYQFPKKIAEKYKVTNDQVSIQEVFGKLNTKYTQPGALLQGIRTRENLTQMQLAKMINVTQSDISQMEKGVRKIGRNIAQRIESLFDINYRSFLD